MLNSFMTMATFSSWNSIKKAHHVDFVASSMLEFLIDNIFVSFGGTLFQQVYSFKEF